MLSLLLLLIYSVVVVVGISVCEWVCCVGVCVCVHLCVHASMCVHGFMCVYVCVCVHTYKLPAHTLLHNHSISIINCCLHPPIQTVLFQLCGAVGRHVHAL